MTGYEEVVAKLEAEGWPMIDHFRMTPWVPLSQSDRIYREMIATLLPGLTMISLHPNKSGDIETISPLKAHFRTDEFRLLSDPAFRRFLTQQEIKTTGFRILRDLLRTRTELLPE